MIAVRPDRCGPGNPVPILKRASAPILYLSSGLHDLSHIFMAEYHRKVEDLASRMAHPGMGIGSANTRHHHFHENSPWLDLLRKGIGTDLKGLIETNHNRCFSRFHQSFSLHKVIDQWNKKIWPFRRCKKILLPAQASFRPTGMGGLVKL